MDATCGVVLNQTTDVERFTALVWSAAVYDRLHDPSTRHFLKALDELLGRSAEATAALGPNSEFAQALMQVGR